MNRLNDDSETPSGPIQGVRNFSRMGNKQSSEKQEQGKFKIEFVIAKKLRIKKYIEKNILMSTSF